MQIELINKQNTHAYWWARAIANFSWCKSFSVTRCKCWYGIFDTFGCGHFFTVCVKKWCFHCVAGKPFLLQKQKSIIEICWFNEVIGRWWLSQPISVQKTQRYEVKYLRVKSHLFHNDCLWWFMGDSRIWAPNRNCTMGFDLDGTMEFEAGFIWSGCTK